MKEIEVNFKSAKLNLEGCLVLPDTPQLCPGVVLCHPHPLYGGNMDNNVIMAVSRTLTDRGIAALRFNFRGVGSSEGSYGEGIGEEADALAALSYLAGREEVEASRLGLMGYSFGGMVALSSGLHSNLVKAMAGVSPVITEGMLMECAKPILIIYGTNDDVVLPSTILQEVKNLPPGSVEPFDGADHFWWGHAKKAAKKVASFFAEKLI
ncbi:MAG: dienelactone hydrolase family protein [Bacillota bacterium]|nr:dienelactone hydrolase family protein [Bacillota bacterium]